MCSHLTYYKVVNKDCNFLINGKNVFDKIINKDIRQVFNEKKLFQEEHFIGIPSYGMLIGEEHGCSLINFVFQTR